MLTVLADSGPLIALAKLNRLELLLNLWQTVLVTETVYHETVVLGQSREAADALTLRLFWQQHRLPIVSVPAATLTAYAPALQLDPGEHATFALALTFPEALVLVDDEEARAEARRLGLRMRGTLGVVVEAFRRQQLTFSEAELLLTEIAARPDIWISPVLCEQVLKSLQPRR
jgi:predicted nucleic acid-binding protein